MFLELFFNKGYECAHSSFSPDKEFGYCPDCGEFIENEWFITRCACCGVKQKAIIKSGEIRPARKYCHNCGTVNYVVEKLPKINFIDIQFAVLIKSVIKNSNYDFTQSWVDTRKTNDKPRLLPLYR